MPETSRINGPGVLLAASLLAAILGSVHAFSVFLAPLEARFDQPRGMVSLTYSLALVVLTLAVLWGHRWYGRWSAGRFVTGICLLGAAGALFAALAPNLMLVWLGYSVLFGCANGLGYGFGLQIAAQANPGREGMAMGVVTAAYALGAVLSPAGFAAAVASGGYRAAMLGLMAVLLLTGPVSGGLMHLSRAGFKHAGQQAARARVPLISLLLLWLGYGAGVAAGLMTIGHAAGIGTALGFSGADWVAPAVIAICNLTGSLIAGQLADKVTPLRILIGLPLLSAAAACLLARADDASHLLLMLGVIGFAYGGIIAAYPAAIAKIFGVLDGPSIYGRVFTAWGTAGLLAPWLAGSLFDLTGAYRVALTGGGRAWRAIGPVGAGPVGAQPGGCVRGIEKGPMQSAPAPFVFSGCVSDVLLDLARLEAAQVAFKLGLDDRHQEVEAEDVHNRHCKDRRIREVDDRAKAGGGTDHDEDAEHDLEHQLLGLAFAEQVGPGLEAVIGPADHRREGKQYHRDRQDDTGTS